MRCSLDGILKTQDNNKKENEMAKQVEVFADVLHHLVDYSRFDNETDLNTAHALIDEQFPPVVEAAPSTNTGQ